MTATTFRVDTRREMTAMGNAFKATLATGDLEQVYANRPPDFSDTPCLYIGGIEEVIRLGAGIRQRDLSVTTVLVDELTDNEETAYRLDALADAWLDYLTDNPHGIAAVTLLTPQRMAAPELSVGGVFYASVITTVLAQIGEART